MRSEDASVEVERLTGPFPGRALLGLVLGFVLAALLGWLWIPTPDTLQQLGKVGEQMPLPLSGTKPSFLPLDKPKGEFRAFVVGASLTYGLPYEPEVVASYATLLSVAYRKVLGRTDIHIRPEARPAWDSGQILEKAEQLLVYHPDLILVVLGTNEYVNRIVYGKAMLPEGIRARIEEAATRSRFLWQRLGEAVLGSKGGSGGGGDFAKLVRSTSPGHPAMGGLPIGPRDRRLLLSRMQQGIRRLHRICKKAGTRLVVLKSLQDLRSFPPWCNDLTGTIPEVDALFVQVWNDPRPALLPRLDALLERYPDRPDLHHARGRLLLAAGKPEDARLEFQKGLDLDLAPLHHTSEVMEAIDEVCRQEGIRLLDLNDALADEHGITGGARFLDAAHVDLEGHEELALYLARNLAGEELPALPADYEARFRTAIRDHLEREVSADTKKTDRARIAFNDAKYFLFFGNFRDAIPYFERCLLDLPEGETRRLYEHALKKLGVPGAGGRKR